MEPTSSSTSLSTSLSSSTSSSSSDDVAIIGKRNDGDVVASNTNGTIVTTTATTTTALSSTPTSSSSSSFSSSSLTLTITYILIWCIHFFQPVIEKIIFGPGHGALDARPLINVDYYVLLPILTTILIHSIMYYNGVYGTKTTTTTTTIDTIRLEGIFMLAIVAHIIDIVIRLYRMPAVWDHEYWATWINLSFVVCFVRPVLLSDGSSSSASSDDDDSAVTPTTTTTKRQKSFFTLYKSGQDTFIPLARVQLGILYLAATFWKINSSFMNPTSSCGTILIVELVGTYLGSRMTMSPSVTAILAKAAPTLTLGVEAILGIGFLYAGCCYDGIPTTTTSSSSTTTTTRTTTTTTTRTVRMMTLLKATIFHILIFMMPVNAAGGFSLDCMTRLVLLCESSEINIALNKMVTSWMYTTKKTVVIVLVSCWIRHIATDTIAPMWDVGFTSSILLGVFYWEVAVASMSTPTFPDSESVPSPNKTETVATSSDSDQSTFFQPIPKQDDGEKTTELDTPSPPLKITITTVTILVGTFFYAFIGTILGIQQMGAPTMYANLRSYKGGNHYLVPTATLGEGLLYGGGLLQVIESNSTAINMLLGYTKSDDVFPQKIVHYLETTIRSGKHQSRGGGKVVSSSSSTLPFSSSPYDGMPLQLFPMCIFNPHSRDVLLEVYQQSNPLGSPVFVPFIMPLSTIRSTIQEAQDREERFVVKLMYPAYGPDGTTDKVKEHEQSTIVMDHTGMCTVQKQYFNNNNGRNKKTKMGRSSILCQDDDVARLLLIPKSQQGPWQWLVDKILTPYPEIVGLEEEVCMA